MALRAPVPAAEAQVPSWANTPAPVAVGTADTGTIETAFDGEGNGVAAWVRHGLQVLDLRARGRGDVERAARVPRPGRLRRVRSGGRRSLRRHGRGRLDPDTVAIPSRTIVEARYRPAGGTFGDPVTLSDPSVNAETPGIAFAPDGTAYVAYGHGLSASSNARLSSRAPGADTWSAETVGGSQASRPVYDARVGVGSDGLVVVAWATGFLNFDGDAGVDETPSG